MMVEFKMSLLIFALLSITTFHECHSVCNKPECNIIDKEIFTMHERDVILELHNKIRNEIAGGVGKLPQASDMIEMEWENVLEQSARNWSQQCKFEFDHEIYKSYDKYERFGQMLYIKGPSNFTKGEKKIEDKERENNLRDAMEFINLKRDHLSDYWVHNYKPGEDYDAFTQIIWAKSWRIGCGRVYWKEEEGEKFMLVCNYGPTGNEEGKPVYKSGIPGENCPKGTCFGKSACEIFNKVSIYENLCKVKDVNGSDILNITKSRLHRKEKTDDNQPLDYGYDYDNLPYDYGYGDGSLPDDYGSDDYLPHDYGSRDDYHYGYNY